MTEWGLGVKADYSDYKYQLKQLWKDLKHLVGSFCRLKNALKIVPLLDSNILTSYSQPEHFPHIKLIIFTITVWKAVISQQEQLLWSQWFSQTSFFELKTKESRAASCLILSRMINDSHCFQSFILFRKTIRAQFKDATFYVLHCKTLSSKLTVPLCLQNNINYP